MAITSLPTPPTRQDPNTFASRGDAFLAALPTFQAEANALASDVNTLAASAASAASDALSSAASAQASLSAFSSALGLTAQVVTGTSQAAAAGNLYVLQNAGQTTVTLPASPAAGDVVGVIPSNGREDNIVARNGKQICGFSEDMTIDFLGVPVILKYIDSTSQWRIWQ